MGQRGGKGGGWGKGLRDGGKGGERVKGIVKRGMH
jgi:hypothetical protein